MYAGILASAVFLKNRNIISNIKISKDTDYAALSTELGKDLANVMLFKAYKYGKNA